MGQKNASFRCSQWNDAHSKWVSTLFVIQANGHLVSYNRKTRRFIAGVQLTSAYPLLVFGPLCEKMKWTPPLPNGHIEANLLGIPTGTDAFQDEHKICWFYFDESKVLISLLEAILIVLDKLKVDLPGGEDGRSRRKRRNSRISSSKSMDFSETAGLGMVMTKNGFLDLSNWYIDGLAGGWIIGEVPVSDPRCFRRSECAAATLCTVAVVDASVRAGLNGQWGSNCGSEWDTSGACAALNAAGVFCSVDSHDFSGVTGIGADHGAWGAYDGGAYVDVSGFAHAHAAACGAHACGGHACGGAGCGGGGCGGGGCGGGGM